MNMAGHNLKHVPLELTTGPPLVSLHLGYNLLQTLNPRLFAMAFLAQLNLDQNDLRELPSSIGNCVSLRVLTAKNNRCPQVPYRNAYTQHHAALLAACVLQKAACDAREKYENTVISQGRDLSF